MVGIFVNHPPSIVEKNAAWYTMNCLNALHYQLWILFSTALGKNRVRMNHGRKFRSLL